MRELAKPARTPQDLRVHDSRSIHWFVWRGSGFVLVVLAVACAPSRESITAGQIGCPPDEVTIGNEASSGGLFQSSETWSAECRGRKFVCGKLTTGSISDTDDPLLIQPTDSDVTCREELGTDKPLAIGPSGSSAAAASPATAKATAAPTGGAGFELGGTRDTARAACESAGNKWELSGSVASCSGPATKLGFDVGVTFDLCRDRVCKITIAHSPETKWASALAELKTKLSEKYGVPADSDASLPSNCRSDSEMLACFDKGLRLRFGWSWKSGETLRLSAGKPETGDGPAAIRLEYARPEGALGADASAL